MSPVTEHVATLADMWAESMGRRWCDQTPPFTDAMSAALGLENGLQRDWAPGTRLELLKAATAHSTASVEAFVTLACRDWPADIEKGESYWLLPFQLAWLWAGEQLLEPALVPAGFDPNDLPEFADRT